MEPYNHINQMQASLVKMQQALVSATTAQIRTWQRLETAIAEVEKWKSRKKLAQEKGASDLVKEAALREEVWTENVERLRMQSSRDAETISQLKKKIIDIEVEMTYSIQIDSQQSSTWDEQFNSIDKIVGAVERLEQKFRHIAVLTQETYQEFSVLKLAIHKQQHKQKIESLSLQQEQLETRVLRQSSALTGENLEIHFAEPVYEEIDIQLEAMKAYMLGQQKTGTSIQLADLDLTELEDLKRRLDYL
ncbi:PspA/IM30 family protein [Leptolyngbya sp. NIES-3755]|nr:PspA/IM30 family protein [Leptolyngbya sp. NIES-3755]